tara:strand:- start:176 stop:553 length:378 start_codon:yes stop_codon:yes gene_type:complete
MISPTTANLMQDPEGNPCYCFISRNDIEKMNNESIELNFNRNIDPHTIKKFSNNHNCLVFFMMTHEHKQGIKCEPHLRIMFYASLQSKENTDNKPELFILDTLINTFEEHVMYVAVDAENDIVTQ